MFTNFRLKIREFFRNYKYIIILVIVALFIIIAVNQFFKNYEEPVIPQTSYKPNTPIINEKEEVPEEEQVPIQEIFDEYVGYCNQKDYQSAYNMLSTACKEAVYPNIESFSKYIDAVFDQKKIYNIQNMSNIDGAYIYRIRYLDDILATGLTGEDSVWYDEDIITVVTEDGQKKLNIREFIKTEELNKVYENDYLRMEIKDKVIQYEAETYHITVTNRSEYTIVIADFSQENEVTLQAGSQTLSYEKEYSNMMVIRPGETGYYTLMFGKDYDLSSETDSLNLNMVRILKSYTGTEETREEELKNAEAIYSVKIDL